MASLRDWIWLSSRKGLTLRGQRLVLSYFGSPEEAFLADRATIQEIPGLSDREREALMQKDTAGAEAILSDCSDKGIRIVTCQGEAYPQRLLAIDTPPVVLYYKGQLLSFDQLPVITVVGSRSASAYGLSVARYMGRQLAACGGVVLSGAARGIDSQALEGALEEGGTVAAVVGNGLDIVYPKSSESVYQAVCQYGCLISEYPPGTPPAARNFPQRNRIMSGLALGVLVVEAPKQSGSLITAGLALEQGRDVFAVPGNIGLKSCEGSNELLRDGAMLVTNGWDVLQDYAVRFPGQLAKKSKAVAKPAQQTKLHSESQRDDNVEKKPEESLTDKAESHANTENRIDKDVNRNYSDQQEKAAALSASEKTIVSALAQGRVHVDELTEKTGLPVARVLAALTLLEVKGFVIQEPGKYFHLNNN